MSPRSLTACAHSLRFRYPIKYEGAYLNSFLVLLDEPVDRCGNSKVNFIESSACRFRKLIILAQKTMIIATTAVIGGVIVVAAVIGGASPRQNCRISIFG